MKIAILTQPLYNNYGGILQNYALQQVLKKMGHEACTINRHTKINKTPLHYKVGSFIKRIFRKSFNKNIRIRVWETNKERAIILQHFRRFIENNIYLTKEIKSLKQLYSLSEQFDAFIIGSDQVWRPKYSPGIKNYFLDFVKNNSIKKIAYAASFGVDTWEYNIKDTKDCSSLAQKFNTISVRENSAVRLCKNFLNVEVTQVLDPTLLLSKESYVDLITNDNSTKSKGNLFAYILDYTEEKKYILQKVKDITQLIPFNVKPEREFCEIDNYSIDEMIFPSIYQWLRAFNDADYIVTDSYHGTVFSIIFRKPFITIENKNRGLSRFTSLLETFKLEERLILNVEDISNKLIIEPIAFDEVYQILESEKKRSIDFLLNSLI